MGGAAYGDKSDTRSELPSPGIGGQHSPPMKSPDRLIPVGGGVRSWNSVSNSNNAPNSNQSVSDYDERGGQPPPDASDSHGQGTYIPPVGAAHEMAGNQNNPQSQFAHSRTISGESQPSELGEGTLPANHPQRTLSGRAQKYQHQRTFSGTTQQGSVDADGYWQSSSQNPQELQGSPTYASRSNEGYRGVDPEVPLHQRMQTERVPVRQGHLQKPPPGGNLPPSHNF